MLEHRSEDPRRDAAGRSQRTAAIAKRAVTTVAVVLGTMLPFGVAGCPAAHDDAPADPGVRTCGLDIWYHATSAQAQVEVVGSWSDFSRPGTFVPATRADGWRALHLDLADGQYRYAIVDDGVWRADPLVPTTAWQDQNEVSWVDVPNCGAPLLTVSGVDADAAGRAVVHLTFTGAHADGHELAPQSIAVYTHEGATITPDAILANPQSRTIDVTLSGLGRGKSVYTVTAKDVTGRITAPARASVWIGAHAAREDVAIYQVMIDRFRGNDGALAAPDEPAGRAGGTLRGVQNALEHGDFEAMGINTLWLSPVYRNPSGYFAGGAGKLFSGYHGYWPIDTRAVDPGLGSDADLDALIHSAHARGISVLLDVVPNHVHNEHPYWTGRASDLDFNKPDGTCVCGTSSCPWSTYIEQCWFASYLPDLNTRHEDVLAKVTDDVLYWLDRFELDGLRIDAVPMMPRSTTRRIAALSRAAFAHPGHSLYLVGETFTDEGGYDAIRYNLGPMGLDGQFHFPLMWAIRGSIASGTAPLSDIDRAIQEGQAAFQGSGAVMATIIGNHDVTRFASESDGTAGGDGFEPAPMPTDPVVFEKQKLALGLLFALPGAPVIYYGDEVALPGRSDPDSRRVMPGDDALTDAARAVRDFVRRAGKVRACSSLLRRGSYLPIAADAETLIFARQSASNDATDGSSASGSADANPAPNGSPPALVVVTRKPATAGSTSPAQTVRFDKAVVPPGRYLDAIDGSALSVDEDGLTSLTLPPFSLRIFLPEGDPCATSP